MLAGDKLLLCYCCTHANVVGCWRKVLNVEFALAGVVLWCVCGAAACRTSGQLLAQIVATLLVTKFHLTLGIYFSVVIVSPLSYQLVFRANCFTPRNSHIKILLLYIHISRMQIQSGFKVQNGLTNSANMKNMPANIRMYI